MYNHNNDDLQAFLIQAELVNQKVKALAENKMTPEEFDRLQALRAQDKRKRQNAQIKKAELQIKKKQEGYQGKGISKDFKNFCKFCRWEYELQTPKCFKCQRNTMTLEQRQTQLESMVQQYKKKKKSREQRKHKWNMWQKTQSSLWRKTSNKYTKWQYFISDSEEEPEQDPITPKNDPNFMALQVDLQERKKRRKKDQAETLKFKEKGNQLMKQGKYQQAMHKYTFALDHAKDIKSVYTNRALAYIKLGKYKKAIKDCSNVIEYMQVFQKLGQNKDLTFKAYTRRAMAKKQLKQYRQALQDVNEGLKLFPQDKHAILLKKQLEGFSEHAEKVQKLLRQNSQAQMQKQGKVQQQQMKEEESIKQADRMEYDQEKIQQDQKDIVKEIAQAQLLKENAADAENAVKINPQKPSLVKKQKPLLPIEQIKKGIENLTPQSIKEMLELIIKDKNLIPIFIAGKGIQACLNSLISAQFSSQQIFLISLCLEGTGVGQKVVWDFQIQKIHARITQLLNDTTNQKQHVHQIIEDLFEILVPISLYEPYRLKLSNDKAVYKFIEETYTKLISKRKIQTHLMNIFIIYMSNLMSGSQSGLKINEFNKKKFATLIDSLYVLILDQKSRNSNFLDLKRNVYGLIANMLTHPEHRKTFIQFAEKNNKFIEIAEDLEQYPRKLDNFTDYIESIFSVLVNVTFQSNLNIPKLSEILFNRFISHRSNFSKQIVYRSLVVLSRLQSAQLLSNKEKFKKWLSVFEQFSIEEKPLQHPADKNNMIQIVRILNNMYLLKDSQQHEIPAKLFKALTSYINDNLVHQNLFCNTANLFGLIVSSKNPMKQQICIAIANSMKRLVFIAKEKTGNWRKSSAILIAKCSSNAKCKEQMQKEHAMDVIKSIAHLIAGK